MRYVCVRVPFHAHTPFPSVCSRTRVLLLLCPEQKRTAMNAKLAREIMIVSKGEQWIAERRMSTEAGGSEWVYACVFGE